VIRAVTKGATLNYNWNVMGILDGFEGLIHKRFEKLTYDSVKGIIDKGGTILGSSNRGNPFEYKTKDSGSIKTEDVSGKVLENIAKLKIDALVVIGGDGTMSIANQLAKSGLPLVGIPKTIDNDLSGTDRTFGFDTAVNTAIEAIDKIRTTAESHHRVMIVEVMGRYAGWIALHSGISTGADIILIPEIPYIPEKIYETIKARMDKKRNYSIIVVKMFVKDSVETARLGGIAMKIAGEIREKLDVPSRATVLGHIQRGGSPSALDRTLGTRLGFHAVELIANGEFGKMSALKGMTITSVPIEQATVSLRKVDPEGELVNCAKKLGVVFGD